MIKQISKYIFVVSAILIIASVATLFIKITSLPPVESMFPHPNVSGDVVRNTNIIKPKIIISGGDTQFARDLNDDRNLMGDSHNVFVGKVIGEAGSEGWNTEFEVRVLKNIKGGLWGDILVHVTGGYRDGVFYVMEGATWLEPGSTYLLATRYGGGNVYHLISFPASWKLLSQDSNLTDAQLSTMAGNDLRVQQLEAAYPNEILLPIDVAHNEARNSYVSTHVSPPAPPPPPAASSTTPVVPPVILNLTAAVASTSVTIVWTTDVPATTQLLFGSSTAMVANVPADTNFTTSHSRYVSSLTPSTTYYYEVQSKDVFGNTGISAQQSFTTLGQ